MAALECHTACHGVPRFGELLECAWFLQGQVSGPYESLSPLWLRSDR